MAFSFKAVLMRASVFILLFVLSLAPSVLAEPLQKPFDHSNWDSFLKKYVNEKGDVNFAEIKKDPEPLKKYMRDLRKVDEGSFLEWSREERVALWINAYHAAAIWAIVKHYPIKSIQEIPSVWDTKYVSLKINSYSLNEIRALQLLTAFKDEKINFALSCMAKDCPVLSRDAYVGPKLDGQLFLATRRFINDDRKVMIKPGGKNIQISKFFKWYAKDFSFNFGKPENEEGLTKEEFAVLSFLSFYMEDTDKVAYLEEKKYKIKYPKFDWSLNDWHV